MTKPTFAQLSDPTQGGPGFGPEPPAARLVTILSIIASGQYPDGSPVGGYASLTGPGQTATPGDLTQAGGFTVNDTAGDGINLNSSSSGGFISLDNTGDAGTQIIDEGSGGVEVWSKNASGSLLLAVGTTAGLTPGSITARNENGDIEVISALGVLINPDLNATGTEYLTVTGLPTSNPGGSGRVWNNLGVLSIT